MAFISCLVTTSAVNMDKIMPNANVWANPFTVPEPMNPSTMAAINVVKFPSQIAENAFSNPILMADCTVLPVASSSLILAKIITLASTAIPIDRMIPAIPGRVSVISNRFKRITINAVYILNAMLAAIPITQYTASINITTSTKPTAAAFRLVLIAALPSCAPTTLERSSSSSSFSPPIRMVEARESASSKVKLPVICAFPSVITAFTPGALIIPSS